MIKWKKIDAGEYESEDGRFYILKTWNRLYGNHWTIRDRFEEDYYKGLYNEETFHQCKVRDEQIIDQEEKGGLIND